MSGLFGGGGSAPVQPPVKPEDKKPPKEEDRAVQQAKSEAMRRRLSGRGYKSTILSKNLLNDQSAALQQTLGS